MHSIINFILLILEIGVLGDCTHWGDPTGHDEFCINERKNDKKSGNTIIEDYYQ